MTKPDPIAEAVRALEDVLDGVSRVGMSNLARGDANPANDAHSDADGGEA